MSVAVEKIPDASVLVNFASLRSAYDATVDALQFPQVRKDFSSGKEGLFLR